MIRSAELDRRKERLRQQNIVLELERLAYAEEMARRAGRNEEEALVVRAGHHRERSERWEGWREKLLARWRGLVPDRIADDQASWERRRALLVAYERGQKQKDLARYCGIGKTRISQMILRAQRKGEQISPVERWMDVGGEFIARGDFRGIERRSAILAKAHSRGVYTRLISGVRGERKLSEP